MIMSVRINSIISGKINMQTKNKLKFNCLLKVIVIVLIAISYENF